MVPPYAPIVLVAAPAALCRLVLAATFGFSASLAVLALAPTPDAHLVATSVLIVVLVVGATAHLLRARPSKLPQLQT